MTLTLNMIRIDNAEGRRLLLMITLNLIRIDNAEGRLAATDDNTKPDQDR